MDTDKGIEDPNFGMPGVVMFGGISYGTDEDGEWVAYENMAGICRLIQRAVVSCDVNLTGGHIRAMCCEYDWSRKFLAKEFGVDEQLVLEWQLNEAPCPTAIQNQLKLMGRTQLDPKLMLIEFMVDMRRPATEKLEFRYDAETNNWSWINQQPALASAPQTSED